MLKMYVYNNMSLDYNTNIVDSIERVALRRLHTSKWLSSIVNGRFSHFENLKTHGADHILLQKFLMSVPTTTDPEQADIYLVPFLGGLHTILGWGHGLSRTNSGVNQKIIDWDAWATKNLVAWKRVPHRHIILYNMNDEQVPSKMKSATVLHLGPTRSRPQHIIVPYLILEHEFFVDRESQKRHIFAYLQMTPSRNNIRKTIQNQLIGHADVYLDTHIIGSRARKTIRMMQQSKFCIAPAGDSASFCARFYFALLSGCIPVRIDTYGSNDSYPYVGKEESLDQLVINVSPRQLISHGLINILKNVSDVEDRLARISRIRNYLKFDPRLQAPSVDAFAKVIEQLEERKRCEEEVVTTKSLRETHIGTDGCSLLAFEINIEMCWKNQISAREVLDIKKEIVRTAILC